MCDTEVKVRKSLPLCVQAGQGSLSMGAAIQDFQRTDSEGLNEVKGHLEIALLEKHFLREYLRPPPASPFSLLRLCSWQCCGIPGVGADKLTGVIRWSES